MNGAFTWLFEKSDPRLKETLLTCYRMFTTGSDIIEVLKDKFEEQSQKKNVMEYLEKWIYDKDQV